MHLVTAHNKDEAPDLCGLWVTLHAVYTQWSLARPEAPERKDISDHLFRQLSDMSAIKADDWQTLMTVQGVTPLSLAAYSYCEGASLKALVDTWGKVYEVAKELPATEFEALKFINPALIPKPKVSLILKAGFLHGWQIRLLSHVWAGQDVIHDVEEEFKPEIAGWFNFVKIQG